jgi:hypothetical protein
MPAKTSPLLGALWRWLESRLAFMNILEKLSCRYSEGMKVQ